MRNMCKATKEGKSDMLDRELRAEFESYRKTLDSEEAKRAFDERIERLLSQHGVDYVRGYVDALKDASTKP
jgi:putative component of toxin-antitoxin plasmid stabilization module